MHVKCYPLVVLWAYAMCLHSFMRHQGNCLKTPCYAGCFRMLAYALGDGKQRGALAGVKASVLLTLL